MDVSARDLEPKHAALLNYGTLPSPEQLADIAEIALQVCILHYLFL